MISAARGSQLPAPLMVEVGFPADGFHQTRNVSNIWKSNVPPKAQFDINTTSHQQMQGHCTKHLFQANFTSVTTDISQMSQ